MVLLPGMLVILFFTNGCGPSGANVTTGIRPEDVGNTYRDSDWATVLRQCAWHGLVDYEQLSRHREPLDRYCTLLSVVGPTKTPDQFPAGADRTAYWINAYNALVLCAVLEQYPVESMYELGMPRLEHDYRFRVDGRQMNLLQVEQEMLEAGRNDARTILATSGACVGSPRLAGEPYRPGALSRQLDEAAARALDNPFVMRIDHGDRAILLWQKIIRRKDLFLEYWRRVRRSSRGYMFNVLVELASPEQRNRLQSAVGYQIREIPFDRRLNDTKLLSGEGRTTVPPPRTDRPIVP